MTTSGGVERETDERIKRALEAIWAGVPDILRAKAEVANPRDGQLHTIPCLLGGLKLLHDAIQIVRQEGN